MVAAKIRNPEEVKRGELLIARCDFIVMDSVQYNELNDAAVLKDVAKEYRAKLGVLDRDTDGYRDEVGTDATLHEIRRKIKDISDICKHFDARAEKLNKEINPSAGRKWCAQHNKYDCPAHPDVKPVATKVYAAPLAADRSPMDVKLGEYVDMSERFDFACGSCPHAKDCFGRSVCFNAIKEMVPEDTDSDELKRLIEQAFVVTAVGTHGSEDDMTPTFDHCTICWERISFGESYCSECYDAMGEVQAEVRNADGEMEPVVYDRPINYPDVDSWADAW